MQKGPQEKQRRYENKWKQVFVLWHSFMVYIVRVNCRGYWINNGI